MSKSAERAKRWRRNNRARVTAQIRRMVADSQARRAQGFCKYCRAESVFGRSACAKHLEAQRQYVSKHRAGGSEPQRLRPRDLERVYQRRIADELRLYRDAQIRAEWMPLAATAFREPAWDPPAFLRPIIWHEDDFVDERTPLSGLLYKESLDQEASIA